VAIEKVCGIETEYGIHSVGGDGNPITARHCSSTRMPPR